MEQCRGDRLVVELELGADARDRIGMVDELLARAALLAFVGGRGEAEGARDQVAIEVRVVLGDLGDQLVDELLMSFRSLEQRHIQMVLRDGAGPAGEAGTASVGAFRRN